MVNGPLAPDASALQAAPSQRLGPSPGTNSPLDYLCPGSASYPVLVHRPAIWSWAHRSTPPRDDALALWLTFGSADTWYRDLHPAGFVPCTAHNRDRKEPRGPSLPHHRTYGSRIRRFGRLSRHTWTPPRRIDEAAPRVSTGASLYAAPPAVSPQPARLRPRDSPDAVPPILGIRLLLSFKPLSGHRSGLRQAFVARRLHPSYYALC